MGLTNAQTPPQDTELDLRVLHETQLGARIPQDLNPRSQMRANEGELPRWMDGDAQHEETRVRGEFHGGQR